MKGHSGGFFSTVLSRPLPPIAPPVLILRAPRVYQPTCFCTLALGRPPLQGIPSSLPPKTITPAAALAPPSPSVFLLQWVFPTSIPTCTKIAHLKKVLSTPHPHQITALFLSSTIKLSGCCLYLLSDYSLTLLV